MRAAAIIFAFALAITGLTACGTSKYENDPDYGSGFTDGCSTGSDRVGGGPPTKPTRDETLWKASEGYRAGWKAGYSSCSPGSRGDTPGGDRDIGGRGDR